MRLLFSLLGFLLTLSVSSQQIEYPALPKSAATLGEFVSGDWKMLTSDVGDLNKDGYPDVAFILQSLSSYPCDPDSDSDATFSPRVLGIALWDNAAKRFNLKVQSNQFIMTNEGNATMMDPFVSMEIKKGTLNFKFSYWYSMGSWYTGNQEFIFRFQNNRFELIGYEIGSFHRATHESTVTSINYSTRKGSVSYAEDDESEAVVKWGTFKMSALPTFETIGLPFDFTFPELTFGN